MYTKVRYYSENIKESRMMYCNFLKIRDKNDVKTRHLILGNE